MGRGRKNQEKKMRRRKGQVKKKERLKKKADTVRASRKRRS